MVSVPRCQWPANVLLGRLGMKGFIRRRGDAWELRVYLGVDPVSGKQRYSSRTFRGGKRDAQSALAQMIVDANRGAMARTTATLGQLLDEWLDQAQRDFSPKTVRETRGFIERTIKPELGHISLTRLRPMTLDRFYAKLVAPGGGRNGEGLSPSTVRRVHGIIRRALAQGVRWGWLGTNPAASASPPRVPPTTIQPPTPTELALLLRAAERSDARLAAFLMLSAATGARRSELIALRWSDIDLDTCVVTITRGVVLGPSGLQEKDTKTPSAPRHARSHDDRVSCAPFSDRDRAGDALRDHTCRRPLRVHDRPRQHPVVPGFGEPTLSRTRP